MRRRIQDYLIYLLVRVFICVVQSMPIETCRSLAKVLASIACDLVGLRRQVVDENLLLAFPRLEAGQRRQLARRMWEHLFLMVCEIAHVPRKIHDSNYRDYIQITGLRRLATYLLDPRPSVVISAHFGNFEVAGYLAGLLGFPSYTVARPLDNPFLHDYVNRFRGANGQHILPKKGSARQVQEVLDRGGIISLLGDQHAGPKGCWVDFFGKPASCHKAIAVFTLLSGAPMLVTYARRRGRPLQFEVGLADVMDPRQPCHELASINSLTQWYNKQLEAIIRSAPEQYWWVHRRWKAGRRARRKSQPPNGRASSEQSGEQRVA